MSFNPADLFLELLREEGNETNTNLANDYSITPADFIVTPPDNFGYEIHRLSMKIRATGSTTASGFGNISGGLTNGLKLFVTVKGQEVELNPTSIQTNGDLYVFFDKVYFERFDATGGGDKTIAAIWDTPVQEIGITVLEDQKIIMRVSDDLSDLNKVEVTIQGRRARQPSIS